MLATVVSHNKRCTSLSPQSQANAGPCQTVLRGDGSDTIFSMLMKLALKHLDAIAFLQGFQPRKDRRKPRQKQKDEATLAALEAAEAAAEHGLPDPEMQPAVAGRDPILDELTIDNVQLELWVAVGRGLIANAQAKACQQLFEDGLAAFGRCVGPCRICIGTAFHYRLCSLGGCKKLLCRLY